MQPTAYETRSRTRALQPGRQNGSLVRALRNDRRDWRGVSPPQPQARARGSIGLSKPYAAMKILVVRPLHLKRRLDSSIHLLPRRSSTHDSSPTASMDSRGSSQPSQSPATSRFDPVLRAPVPPVSFERDSWTSATFVGIGGAIGSRKLRVRLLSLASLIERGPQEVTSRLVTCKQPRRTLRGTDSPA